MPDINITGKERETLIEWLDGEIETVEKYRKVMKRKDFVDEIRKRDDERDLHRGDMLLIVSTSPDGIHVMHKKDVEKGIGKAYRLKLEEIYP